MDKIEKEKGMPDEKKEDDEDLITKECKNCNQTDCFYWHFYNKTNV